jgi:hypothetical protein
VAQWSRRRAVLLFRYHVLHQFLQYHVIHDSKPVANTLLGLEPEYPQVPPPLLPPASVPLAFLARACSAAPARGRAGAARAQGSQYMSTLRGTRTTRVVLRRVQRV